MGANVRYRGTYYNTTGTTVTWKIEILDTEPVAQVINVQLAGQPNESFEGLTQDLKPGIYPASIRFGMYLRPTIKVVQGVTYGIADDILTDIATSAEGRFLARLLKDDILHFVGPIIWDQCSYTDEDIPLLSITAVDGTNRWQTTDYVSEVGQLVYYTVEDTLTAYDSSTLLYDGPITGVSPMTVVEHTVDRYVPWNNPTLFRWTVKTTFVHREVFSINSPGTGWVFQGEGKWAKSVSGTNATITDNGPASYHYTLDIDDEIHRTVLEYITRAMAETNMTDEYPTPDVMFDTAIEWREHSMTTGDPASITRLPETPILGKTWADVMQEICRLFNLRIYYSKGRYHIEQISLRDSTTFTRYTYESDGTLVGTETASLDLDFGALNIDPETGGSYKFLAPFRSVEASIDLENANLLDGVNWRDGEYGQRYLGRIKRPAGNCEMIIYTKVAITSTFDPSVLLLYPQSFLDLICKHEVICIHTIRLENKTTGTTYHLEPAPAILGTYGTWDTGFAELEQEGVGFGWGTTQYTPTKYGHTKDKNYSIYSDNLPGSEGDMIDIFVSFRAYPRFFNDVGAILWLTTHVGKFWSLANTYDNVLKFYEEIITGASPSTWTEINPNASLTYVCENDVNNSIKVKTQVVWADTGQHSKSVEIYNGTNWVQSGSWSIGGSGTAKALLELLVFEIMSLRTLPRKLYSGGFVSSLPNAENRFQRGTSYYLPLSCTKNTDVDAFQGEFLEIAKTTPPDVDVITDPIAGEPLPGIGDAEPPDDFDIGLYFETNEAITAGATLTEVDIVNTLGASVAAGETVSIVHPTTGVSDNVVLTQDINPGDTVMYFESNVMANTYPDASYIIIKDGDVTITSPAAEKYRYKNKIYNGSTHHVPDSIVDLTRYTTFSSNQHIVYTSIWRNGIRMTPHNAPISNGGPNDLWFDDANNDIVFAIEFVDEDLVIKLGGI